MLTDEQLVRSSLRDAKDDISNLLLTKLNPAPEELMQKVKKVVEDYKRNLQAKANYTEQYVTCCFVNNDYNNGFKTGNSSGHQ